MRSHRGRDHMVVGFTAICAISVYQHDSYELEIFVFLPPMSSVSNFASFSGFSIIDCLFI